MEEIEQHLGNGMLVCSSKSSCGIWSLNVFSSIFIRGFCRWAGVSEARGDYPFSHHKLTVQFYEVSAAQDRKLEGLVHKAILELWRPDPSELTLLLSSKIDSTLLRIPPRAFTLTGSSDPCYVEAYHLADPTDGRITLHLKVGFFFHKYWKILSWLIKKLSNSFFQVINLTENEINRVDIRVGLTGALYFMDGSPQAVRQLRNLVSQVLLQNLIQFDSQFMNFCLLLWVVLNYFFNVTMGSTIYKIMCTFL